MITMNLMAPMMGHPAMLTPFPVECVGVVAEAGAGGGGGNAKPWMLAAGALVVGVTAAAAVAWHSASADSDAPEQGMTTSAAKPNQPARNTPTIPRNAIPMGRNGQADCRPPALTTTSPPTTKARLYATS